MSSAAASNSSSARGSISLQNKYDRVVLLVDMDCFYCQVEEKLDPQLKGQPLAVVQYNAWRGGGIIAVNYAARAKGVTRHIRGEEAKVLCPEIQLVKVPNVREKADLSKYRDAGKEVANVLQRFTPLLERASVDEAYMDITEAVNKRLELMNAGSFTLQPHDLVNSFAVGHAHIGEYVTAMTARVANRNAPENDDDDFDNAAFQHDALDATSVAVQQSDIRLLLGASIANEVRAAVKAETSYECSAGIAHNKILAKLACGMNKPNKQTILPLAQIPPLFATLPVRKITGLGAKYGEEVCERLGVRFLGDLLKFSEVELQRNFDEKNGSWLYNICRGIDLEVVTPRFYSKSIGCCKNFPGRNRITGLKTLTHWLNELAQEICERLVKDQAENNRRAKQMVVNYAQEFETKDISSSRSAPLGGNYDSETLAKHSLDVIKANTQQFLRTGSEAELNNPIKFLGISVGKFETIASGQNTLQAMFAQQEARQQRKSGDSAQSKGEAVGESISEKQEAGRAMVRDKDSLKKYFQTSRDVNTTENNCQNKTKGAAEERALDEKKYDKTDDTKEMIGKENTIKSFFKNYLQAKKEMNSENEQPVGQCKEKKSTSKAITKCENSFKVQETALNYLKEQETNPLESNDSINSYKIDENSNNVASNDEEINTEESQTNSAPEVKSFFLNALRKQRENANSKIKEVVTNQRNVNELSAESKSFFVNALRKEQKTTESAIKQNIDSENSLNEDERISTFANEDIENDDLSNLEADLDVIENEHIKELENNTQPESAKVAAEASTHSLAVNKVAIDTENSAKKRKFSEIAANVEINEISTAAAETAPLDYQANYAEYAIPDLHADYKLDFIKCDICGVKISAGDDRALQTHKDHHFAQQLSQQQRVEYRAEIKTKIVSATASKSPAQKKQKKSPASAGAKSVITKFLKPAAAIVETTHQVAAATSNDSSTSRQAAAAVSEASEMEACADCKQLIPKTEMAEHKDFHVAKELQRKLNQLEVRTVAIVKKSSGNSSANKSHNSSLQLNATQRSGSAVSKPITQYFSQPQV